mmetsp:Transcript_10977/g.22378  ORF Transcript_10977/g.22378 Transcript_10977/m.22378 type:complete len:256 (+) Transcript_10977:380-1147(+)
MTDLSALLTDLTGRVDSGDVEGGKATLANLKIALLDADPTSDTTAQIATSALELGVLLSAADGDLDAFARNVSQLKPHYASASATAAASSRKNHIIGLNLMHLLVDNRLSEFHSELELLSTAEASSPEISFPIHLERQLMVGSYDEVLAAGSRVPHASYGLFMDHLLTTVRDNIADCLEVAYKTMTMDDAVRMMKFGSVAELQSYMEECRDDWIVEDGNRLCFAPPPTGRKADDIPSKKLISNTLTYAAELERIV